MVTFEMKWLMFQGNWDVKYILLASYLIKMVPFKNLKIFFIMKYCHMCSKEASAV